MYFAAFPEIPRWHRWVIEQVQRLGDITTFLNRTRHFFGRPSEDSTIREAIAFEPQSVATGDYTNIAMLNLIKDSYKLEAELGLRPFDVYLQKHDELCLRYLPQYEDLTVNAVRANMEHPVILTNPQGEERIWTIPAEILTGWNLGYYRSETNPDGLAPLSLQRERSHTPDSLLDWKN